jgi:hypothetical protein
MTKWGKQIAVSCFPPVEPTNEHKVETVFSKPGESVLNACAEFVSRFRHARRHGPQYFGDRELSPLVLA